MKLIEDCDYIVGCLYEENNELYHEQKTGEFIKIKDMSTKHIENTLKMMGNCEVTNSKKCEILENELENREVKNEQTNNANSNRG